MPRKDTDSRWQTVRTTATKAANHVPKDHISYPRKKIIEVLRTINELVVSLDQLGSAEMTKQEHDAAVADFIQRHRIFRKAALARQILSEPFPNELGTDEMDELEREMQGIQYWRDRRRKSC